MKSRLLNFRFLLSQLHFSSFQVRMARRYLRAFVSGFFVAVPVSLTVFDRFACVARVEGASMQVSSGHAPLCCGDLWVKDGGGSVGFI